MRETSHNSPIHKEVLDIRSPDFLDRFRELFAQKMESIYGEHSNAVSPETRISIPLKIRQGEKLHIDSWAGDAFASLLQFCPGLNSENIDGLRDSFFKKSE